jgi:hypothetical protein
VEAGEVTFHFTFRDRSARLREGRWFVMRLSAAGLHEANETYKASQISACGTPGSASTASCA